MQVPMTPKRILDRAVKLYPKKTAVVDGDIELTYEAVQSRVYQVIHALDRLNIAPGARVALLDYNTYRYMELYFGLAESSRVLLPLNIRLYPDDYAYIFNDAEAEILVFHADFKPVIEKIRDSAKTVRYYYIADGPADADWISGTYEDLIAGTHPDVLECAVIATPDPKWGEVPKAMISLKSGSQADEKSLIAYCKERLPGFKTPKIIEFVDELPKTGSGKIRKVDLR
ncbi:MAG: AMP-binding enzyme [Desulfobacterales bacterium]